ncbi:hypothetical protein DIPPA_24114 [Diplonema papillatum]|nr:hypothetical protein DIPPA_24114 [Diplonema papillatum]
MQPVAFAAQQQPLQPVGSAPAEPQPLTRANLEEWVSLTAPMAHGAAGYNQLQQQLQLQQQQQQQQHLAPHPVQLQQQQQQQHHQAWVQSLTPVVLQQQGGAPPPRRAQRAAPQPFNLPQLLQEAAIYKTQAAAEAAITQYNVTVPQSPYPQQLQLQQPQQQLQRSPVYHTSPGVSPYRGGAVPQQQQQQQQQQPQQPLPNQGHALHQPQFPHQTPYQSQQAPSPPPGPPSPPSPPRHQSSPTEPQRPANRVAGGAPPGAKPLAAGAAAQKQQQGGAEPSPAAARWCDDDALPGDAADLSPPKKPATNIFDACATRREKRRLGNLIINKALQEGYNRSYGAARRKVARFCRMHGIGEADQSVLVEFLNDLFLAGKQYRGLCLKEFVDAPSRLLEEGLKKKARAPGGMRTKQRKRIFEDDEIESVMSFNTNCTDTWHEAISDDELEELAGWYEDTATLGTRRSSCRSLKLDPSSCRASSAASSCDHGDQEHLTTPPAAALDIDPTTPSGHNGSVCSRRSSRSIGSRTSRASRASSKAGLKYSQLPDDLTLDDRVKVKRADGKEHEGTVRYIGFPQFADKGDTYDGCWVGVALDHAVGNHDGTVDNERYFIAKPQHGVFVRDDKILRTPDKIEGGVFFYPQHRTNRLLRFDVRQEALRPYGFKSGDVIAATHSKYKGQGKAGVVIGVRHGLLYWKIEGEGVTGACACRNTQEETIETFKKKKYKKIGSESLRNYFSEITPEDANAAGDMGKGISDAAMEKVSHIVDPDNEKWEGALVSPTPAEGYQSWMKRLWRKKKVEQVENSKAS